MKSLVLLCGTALLAGCATVPTPAPKPSEQPLNGNMVRSAVAPTSDKDRELAAWARGQGFRLQKRGDKVMWCKSEAQLGSKFPVNNCVSDETLIAMRSTYETNKQELQQALQGCMGGSACSSK